VEEKPLDKGKAIYNLGFHGGTIEMEPSYPIAE
jgi:hypothetical protein